MNYYAFFIIFCIVFLLSNNAYAVCTIPDNTDISVITGCFDNFDNLGNPAGYQNFYYEIPFNLLFYVFIIIFLCFIAYSFYKMTKK